MRTSGLMVAVAAVLFALVSLSHSRPATTRPVHADVHADGYDRPTRAAQPARPDRLDQRGPRGPRFVRRAVLPDRDIRHLTAAPRAGDTDRLAAARTRRHVDPPELVRAGGTGEAVGDGTLRRYAVEVEPRTGVTPEVFAAAVEAILSDPRSWTAGGLHTLQRVDRGRIDLRVTLASPDSVDALCWPLDTRGLQSCWNEDRAVINAFRWEHGATTYGTDLGSYRAYLVNHEVGHGLGREHVDCPGPGEAAPVMVQQTIHLDGCRPNPWPFPDASPTPAATAH